ncbi:DUF6882 domain-containing protein [Millisia brevis]|uniref:DUF6882 domain-containing protein n=1 Tax=Millisia brevis TaxID=264148 RepID=UPI000A01CDBA|nr:DUF6882 domain-containing protein [Millisia brevis]
MTTPLTLADMVDDAALLSLEHQLRLVEVIGGRTCDLDLAAPQASFAGNPPLVADRVHVIGVASPETRTWSWAWSWATRDDLPAPLFGLVVALREFGSKRGIGTLVQPEIGFADLGAEDPRQVADLLAEAAKVFSGRWTSYQMDAGEGAIMTILIEHPSFLLPAPDPERVLRVLQKGTVDLGLRDHRRAVGSYAWLRGLGITFSPDNSTAELTGPGLHAELTFDDTAQLAGIRSIVDGPEHSPSH